MTKRAKKRTKKREQPWMEAARAKLRERAWARDEQANTEAFLDLVTAELRALGARASDEQIRRTLDMVKLAWNLPLLHALSTEPDSADAAIRAEAGRLLVRLPVPHGELARLYKTRYRELGHLTRPVAEVIAQWLDGELTLAIMVADEPIPQEWLLEPGDDGWPKISASLVELAAPVLEALPEGAGADEARAAIDLAVTAWNLPMIDRPHGSVTGDLRRETLEAAARAEQLPPSMRALFDEMVEARRTLFSYDTRIIGVVAVSVRDGRMQVNAGSILLEDGSPGARVIERARKVLREALDAREGGDERP